MGCDRKKKNKFTANKKKNIIFLKKEDIPTVNKHMRNAHHYGSVVNEPDEDP